MLPASNEPKQGAVMPDAAPFGVAVALAPPPSFATVSNSSGGAEMAQVFQDQSSGDIAYEEDPCVICHDEMTATTRNVSLDCGHRFHHVVSKVYGPLSRCCARKCFQRDWSSPLEVNIQVKVAHCCFSKSGQNTSFTLIKCPDGYFIKE